MKVEGAFNYDPIDYNPDWEEQPTEDPNRLSNGYFTKSLSGWYSRKGQWFRVATSGYSGDGCVRVDCDDNGERFESEKVLVTAGETVHVQAAVRWHEIEVNGNPPWSFAIGVTPYFNGGNPGTMTIIDSIDLDGVGPFTVMDGNYVVPGSGVNEISLSLIVNDAVDDGIAFWDDARII